MTPETKSSQSLSTVISLLSTLCRGSPGITHDLLRSQLPDAIQSALRGDERSVTGSGVRGYPERRREVRLGRLGGLRPPSAETRGQSGVSPEHSRGEMRGQAGTAGRIQTVLRGDER